MKEKRRPWNKHCTHTHLQNSIEPHEPKGVLQLDLKFSKQWTGGTAQAENMEQRHHVPCHPDRNMPCQVRLGFITLTPPQPFCLEGWELFPFAAQRSLRTITTHGAKLSPGGMSHVSRLAERLSQPQKRKRLQSRVPHELDLTVA